MNGLIGFFDILGYQNFLENNFAIDSAQEVLDIIDGIPPEVISILSDSTSRVKPEYKEYANLLSHLVFSDTIVFTLPFKEDADEDWKMRARLFMIGSAGLLAAMMFKKGLPVRGVVHEGEFLTKNACLAGRAIVESYRLCEALDYSGLTFTQSLSDQIKKSQKIKLFNGFNTYAFEYLTPMKGGIEQKLLNINWISFLGKDINECSKDVDNFVLKSFWAHQKDCPVSVDVKIRNTVKSIRKMIQIRSAASIK